MDVDQQVFHTPHGDHNQNHGHDFDPNSNSDSDSDSELQENAPGTTNYAEMEPEYDMEFSQFAHNPIELPMSPPRTPSPGPATATGAGVGAEAPRRREPSPFSDATSMTSVGSVETVGYYREEAGRMFPAVENVPSVLPVDRLEMRRVRGQQNVLQLVVGHFHREDIEEVLNPPYDGSIRALDVLCNTPWIDDMALEYPHVKFTGCHIVPVRHPHQPNVQIEIYNLHEGLRGKDESYDVVHGSGLFKFSRDFKFLLTEMRRLLRPGGLLVLYDMEMSAWMRDGSDARAHAPALCAFTAGIVRALTADGVPIANLPLVGSYLRELGGFAEIDDLVVSVPIGAWDTESGSELQVEIGEMVRENCLGALYATVPLMRRTGRSQEEVERLVEEARYELYEKNLELFERVFYVFARKEEAVFDDEGL